MSFRWDRVPGSTFFNTLQSQKNINGNHLKMLLKVFLPNVLKKFLENETAEETNFQLNSRKSCNFPKNALIAGTLIQSTAIFR